MEAMKKIERAHQMYREAAYNDALLFYSEALSMAKTKPQKIALHSNRAACYLKLNHFKKAAEECTWVLELDHDHTGALMLRAQTLVTLKEYQSALFDVKRLIDLNPASEVYQSLEARLKTQLSLAPIPEAETELEEEEEEDEAGTGKELDEDNNNDDLKDDGKFRLKHAAELENKNAEKHNENEEVGHTRGKSLTDKPLPNLQKAESGNVNLKAGVAISPTHKIDKPSEPKPLGWQTITKPKGHSLLDYSRWDRVVDDSSEEESDDDDNECQPQFRFRVKNVGVHAIK